MDWERKAVAGADFECLTKKYKGWTIQVFLEPNNMGDTEFMVFNDRLRGITRFEGIASDDGVARAMAVDFVDYLDAK